MTVRAASISMLLLAAAALALPCAPASPRPAPEWIERPSPRGPFSMHYPAQLDAMAAEIERLLEEGIRELAPRFGLDRVDTIRVLLARDDGEFRRLHGGILPEWGAAFSSPADGVMGINARAVLLEKRPLEVVLRHELSHLLFAQRVGAVHVPTWFLEGLAMIQSRDWSLAYDWRLAGAVWHGRAPALEDLAGPFPRVDAEAATAYLVSFAAVGELFGESDADLVTLTAFIRELGDFDRAFQITFGQHPDDFSLRFEETIAARYRVAGAIAWSSPYWGGLALLFILAYLLKRRRARIILRGWESTGGEG